MSEQPDAELCKVVLVKYDGPCDKDPAHETKQEWEESVLLDALADDKPFIWCSECGEYRKATQAERDRFQEALRGKDVG
jgi:hypothetical protein